MNDLARATMEIADLRERLSESETAKKNLEDQCRVLEGQLKVQVAKTAELRLTIETMIEKMLQ